MNFREKLKRRIVVLIKNFKSDCRFSLWFAMLRIIDEIGWKMHFYKISSIAHQKKDQWILKYLRKKMDILIQKYRCCDDKGRFEESAPVWVCWWDGEKNAPDLVKQCIRSIKKYAEARQVVIIDKDSYLKYIEIPDYMISKVENGQMCLAHLSDYIRVSLIEKYGGLWLDSTIFCADFIPRMYFELPIFTCKSSPVACRYISQMRWTTFVLGGWKGNIFYCFLKEAFEEYWSKEEGAIDYLFFDYLIELARCEIPAVSKYMECIPINNLHRDELQVAMNCAVDSKKIKEIIKSDTILYKLSWRESYNLKTYDGKKSIYQYFINSDF